MFPYLVLLRVGFSLPLNVATSAVGSYPTFSTLPDPLRAIGGIFSVPLSIASRRPAVSRHPALWSPDFPLATAKIRVTRTSAAQRATA